MVEDSSELMMSYCPVPHSGRVQSSNLSPFRYSSTPVLNVWVELEPTILSGSLFHWLQALTVRKDLLTRLFTLNFASRSECPLVCLLPVIES